MLGSAAAIMCPTHDAQHYATILSRSQTMPCIIIPYHLNKKSNK